VRVSVVIPAFNATRWIEETLASVEPQGDDVEVIVVDDHSDDGTPELARAHLARSGLTGQVVTTERNGGPSQARNLGWRRARGQWVQFLDADDLLAPGKLDVQFAAAQRCPDHVGVLYSPWQHLAPVGPDWAPRGPVVRSRLAAEAGTDAVAAMLEDLGFGYVGPALIRRSALDAVGGFAADMAMGEDFALMLRLAMAGSAVRWVDSDRPLFFYRETPASLWQRAAADPVAVMQLDRAVRSAHQYLENSAGEGSATRLPPAVRRALAQRYLLNLDTLDAQDPDAFASVLDWIGELGLRSAQPGSHLPVRLTARAFGLATSLRLAYGLRGVRRRFTRP
jgi:glycosyltransferase involved in cell wall biosynthesis